MMKAATIDVRSVADRNGVDDFIRVPHRVFASDGNWVAPLDMERREHLSGKHNPYYRHAEVQLFVAYIDDEPVGRISAQVDTLRLERYGDNGGQFGHLDAVDDEPVFKALFATAEDWLRQRGATRVLGPFSHSINEETGLLVDGFDTPPAIMMGHALPYYGAHVEACGYTRAKDLIAYDYDGLTPLPRAMQSMVDKALRSGDMTVRPLNKKNLAGELDIIMSIFNDAWSENWEFVPMTRAEIAALGKNLKFLVAKGYIAIADWQGEPAAMAVTLPDINDWLKDLNGRLMPFGWAKLLWRLYGGPPRAVRLPLMGVLKKHQASSVGAALALGVIDAVRSYHVARGTTHGELSWILDDNMPMRRMIEALGAKPYKTYRVYERDI